MASRSETVANRRSSGENKKGGSTELAKSWKERFGRYEKRGEERKKSETRRLTRSLQNRPINLRPLRLRQEVAHDLLTAC